MSRTKIIETLLLAALMSGCVKNELDAGYTENIDTSGAISFGASADWTRGAEVETITSLGLYSIFSDEKWADATVSNLSSYFNSDYTSSIELTSKDGGATLEYSGGTRYWPTAEGQYLNFYALYPESELTTTFDSESGKPVFNYTMMELANENDDIIFDARFDMTSQTSNGVVDLTMEHILTKLTLWAKTENSVNDSDLVAYSYTDDATTITVRADEYFLINGITFSGLYNNAELKVDFTNGETTWEHEVTTIEVSAAQDNTLLPIFTYDEDGEVNGINSAAILSDELQSVMNIDEIAETTKAIFMLPQELGAIKRGDAAPTAKVRIRRVYYTEKDILMSTEVGEEETPQIYSKYINTNEVIVTENGIITNPADLGYDEEVTYHFYYNTTVPSGEVIYETASVVIPAADDKDGWEQGDHNKLQFTFNLSLLSEYDTPLTLTSTIYDWTETTVDVDVNPNIYMYANANLFEVASDAKYADMIICTNYEYDLRRHRRKYELDGTATEAAGFTYYMVDNTATNQESWTDVGDALEPVLLWNGLTTFPSGSDYTYTDLTPYTYGYNENNELYISPDGGTTQTILTLDADGHFDPTPFEDSEGWMYFAIQPTGEIRERDFYYKVKKETRAELDMYTSTAISNDTSYGINKNEDDAVYTLRLNINDDHLDKTANDGYGYFFGKIGAEALSNGGGLITTKFKVTLKQTLENN